ncbi:MAG: hypothetical protein WA194_01870 [Patescibacteria group bacterium]
MFPAGLVLVLVGVIVIIAPEFIAYFIGTLLILVGANLLLVSYGVHRANRKDEPSSGFRFGDYEIIRNRKK